MHCLSLSEWLSHSDKAASHYPFAGGCETSQSLQLSGVEGKLGVDVGRQWSHQHTLPYATLAPDSQLRSGHYILQRADMQALANELSRRF